MIFQQFEVTGLSHYSYAVGCNGTKEIAIIDPKRDIDTYIEYAGENDYTIKYVLETHIHADYASGAKELAEVTGAELGVSAYDENETYHVAFNHSDLKEGDKVVMGNIELEALHTPGHTPEHISFLLYDKSRDKEQALMMFSGDFLFIGSVGRPDLLGEEAKMDLAKQLHHSVTEKLKNLPDGLEIYPAHGAGSLCGAGMSSANHSTLGMERKTNPYLNKEYSQDEFVDIILSKSPPFPEYYKRMKKINSDGPAILDGLPGIHNKLRPQEWHDMTKEEGVQILDLRHPLAFGGGHFPGSVNVQQDTTLSSWAPWVIEYDKPIYLVADEEDHIEEAIRRLVQVGLDEVKAYLIDLTSWIHAGHNFAQIPQRSVEELNEKLGENEQVRVIDVRSDNEWEDGHIKGSEHIYLGYLPEKLNEIPDKDKPVYTICGGGFRSSIAASILQKNGFTNVMNTFGGMTGWKAAGLEITT